VVTVLAAALLSATPVSAHSDDSNQNTQSQNQKNDSDNGKNSKIKDPAINVETGACVFLGDNEGTIGIDVANSNDFKLTYKVTVDGKEKPVTVASHGTEYIAFTGLAIGGYTVDVTGPHDTKASGNATIKQCHEHELPTVSIDACGCVNTGNHDGHLGLTISNTNDYAVTYTVRIGGHSKDVFVDPHSTGTVSFDHLVAGSYDINVSGDDCTHLCLHTTVEQCPAQIQPGQGAGTPTPTSTPISTPAVTPVTPAASAVVQAPIAQPAVLPNTSATELPTPATIVAKIQAPKTSSTASLVLVAIGLPMIAAAAVLRRQQLVSKAE